MNTITFRSLCAAALLFPLTARAASLTEFQQAANNKGCASIPYSDLQQKCVNKQPEVDRFCKQSAYSCDEFDPTGLKRNIEGLKGKNESLNEKRSELSKLRDQLKDKLSSASSDSDKRDLESKISQAGHEDDSAKDEIYENNKKIDDWQRKLESERTQINDRIYNGKNCISARVDMQKIFGEAYSNADHETDPGVVVEAKKLLPYWTDEQKRHNEALGNAQTAVEKCSRML